MAFDPTPAAPAAPAPWPAMFAPAGEVLAWLNRQRPAAASEKRLLLTLRWLVFAELERTAPEPVPRAITEFVPDAADKPPPDLTSGRR